MFAVFDRRLERLGKVLGYEQGKVGVFRLHIRGFICMSVDDCQAVIIVLRRDLSRRVGAEGAHLVIKGRRVIDKLCFVEILIEKIHDLITDLDSDADIHGADLRLDPVPVTDMGKPVRALPADAGSDLIRVKGISLVGNNTADLAVLDQDIRDHGIKAHLHALILKPVLYPLIDLVAFLCTEVSDRAFDQLQVGLDRAATDVFDLLLLIDSVDIFVRAEFQVDRVGFPHKLSGLVIAQDLRQVSADIRRKRQLAVGKSAGSRKAGGNVAWLASHAAPGHSLRTAPLLNGSALFNDKDPHIRFVLYQLICAENAGRACADNDHIIFVIHKNLKITSVLCLRRTRSLCRVRSR